MRRKSAEQFHVRDKLLRKLDDKVRRCRDGCGWRFQAEYFSFFFHVFCFVVVKECVFLAYPKSAGRLDDDDDDDDLQMSEFTIGPLRIMKDPLKRRHMIVGSDLACASPKLLR